MRIAVTGAYGFSGKYIARRLLDLEHDVITLTNSPHRGNPFGESVKAFPYNFSKPRELEDSLRGVDVLINTYWVRFYKPPYFSFAQAVANAKVLFDSAKRAGVRRLIHISITNPDRGSDLPYFRGKAEMEEHIKETGLSHVILRPAVLFGSTVHLLGRESTMELQKDFCNPGPSAALLLPNQPFGFVRSSASSGRSCVTPSSWSRGAPAHPADLHRALILLGKLLFDALPCSRPEMPATVIHAAIEFFRPFQ